MTAMVAWWALWARRGAGRRPRDFALALGLALVAVGSQAQRGAAPSPGDAGRGQALAASRCAACHGLDGQAPDPATPKLAGQLREFLDLQLRNYRSGERPHPVMASLARGLSLQQIADLSAYYAGLPPMRPSPEAAGASAELLARGAAVYRQGRPGVPACQHCHGAQGQGVPPVFARLAGQHAAFVVASLQPYRHVDDFKNPYAFVMKAVGQPLSDAEIAAVAAYIAAMR